MASDPTGASRRFTWVLETVCMLLLGVVTLQGSLSAAATNVCVLCFVYLDI